MAETIILKWQEDVSEGGQCWFLRGIRQDGFYFGETQQFECGQGLQKTVEGQLSDADNDRFLATVERLSGAILDEGLSDRLDNWTGLFAYGPPNQPSVLLRYWKGDEEKSDAAGLFLEVIELFRPYLTDAL